jgi:hypothetical protein
MVFKTEFFTCLPNTTLEKYHGIEEYHNCLKTLKILCSQTPPQMIHWSSSYDSSVFSGSWSEMCAVFS